MRRLRSYNADLSKRLHNRKYAAQFFQGLIEGEDGVPLEKALKATIELMGIKEFSKLAKIPSPNIVEFLKGRRHPKPATLDRYLRPFGLKTYLAVTKAA